MTLTHTKNVTSLNVSLSNLSYAFGCNELFRKAPSDMQIHVHSIVAIHCAIREFVDVGDHYFYICDVENVYTMWMKSHCSLGKVIPRSF